MAAPLNFVEYLEALASAHLEPGRLPEYYCEWIAAECLPLSYLHCRKERSGNRTA